MLKPIETQPLLSIIVPVYNVEEYLADCITSVLDQEYSNFELLLLNDGSTDHSLEICREYEAKDSRICVYTHPNRGQSGTQNRGLDLAQGEYVVFLDSDDSIEPETYASAIKLLETKSDCDLVEFPSRCYHAVRGVWQNPLHDTDIYGAEAMYNAWLFENKIGWTSWCKVYRRSLFDGVRFKEKIYFEDNLMVAQLLSRARGICFSPIGAYRFYVRSTQKTEWTPRHRRDQMTSWCASLEVLQTQYPLYRSARMEFARRIANAYYADTRYASQRDEVTDQAKAALRSLKWLDIWGKNRLSLKDKLKITYLTL